MTMLSKGTLEEIRLRNDIVEVIQSCFPLQRAGATFKALCPFHKEKTPSFHVNPARQIFHCFGCGAGGDVFKFVMLFEHVDFMNAVRRLAERAGVPLKMESGGPRSGERDLLYRLHEDIAALYHRFLIEEREAEPARRYLASRKLDGKTAREFLIGYAPPQWDFLLSWARKAGHPPERLIAAGLLVRAERPEGAGRLYDRFRGRIMFPIRDEQGRVVAFSGRAMTTEAATSKYLNSPETPIFRKSHVLYALDRARQQMLATREALICEGQIDVIRCHLAGFTQAVAAQGTAFTEQHARTLKRYADAVVLAFDSDSAGQQAAIRAAGVFLQADLAARIVALPPGEDPDSFLLRYGSEAFRQILEQAVPALDFQISRFERAGEMKTEAGALRAARSVLEWIRQSPSALHRAALLRDAANRLHFPVSVLQAELARAGGPRSAAVEPARPTADNSIPPEELALCEHLAQHPEAVRMLTEHVPLRFISNPFCRRFIEAVGLCADTDEKMLTVIEELDDESRTLTTLAARFLSAPERLGREYSLDEALRDLILRLWRRELRARRRAAEAAAGNDPHVRVQITHDIKAMQQWDTALPIMRFYLDQERAGNP